MITIFTCRQPTTTEDIDDEAPLATPLARLAPASTPVLPVDIEDSLTRNLLDGAVSGAFYQLSMARLARCGYSGSTDRDEP